MQGESGQGDDHPLKRPPLAERQQLPPSNATGTNTPPRMRPAAVTNQNRNVSWQPSTPPRSGLASPPPSGQRRMQRGHKPTQSIDLQAVLSSGPHELEAETHILRAVEKMTGQAHRKTNTETARLFNTIANDEISRTLNESDLNEHSKHKSQPSGGGGGVQAVPTLNSASESNRSTRLHGKAKFKDLIQKTMAASKSESTTVEQTLFGLSNVLNQMDHTSKSRQAGAKATFDAPLKAADKLAANIDEHLKEEIGAPVPGDLEEGGGTNTDDDESTTDISTSGSEGTGDGAKKGKKRSSKSGAKKLVSTATGGIREDFELLNEFLGGKKKSAMAYARTVFLFIVLPSLILSALFFYFIEDHETDPDTGEVIVGQDASISWWILFIGVRQVVTLTMALITQALVIDYLALGSRFSLRWFGPIITLLVVQSKGWPFVSIFWGTYNLILLSGDERYARHWFYFQDVIGLFNEDNPGGNVINSDLNYTILRLMITIGVVVSIKRLVVGLFLGRQTFAHFGQELATVMKNMVLVGEVATLAREIEKDKEIYEENVMWNQSTSNVWAPNTISDFVNKEADAALEAEVQDAKDNLKAPSAADAATAFMKKHTAGKEVQAPLSPISMADPSVAESVHSDEEFTSAERVDLAELLDAWEEPKRAEESEERKITIGAVMQFRQALQFMKRKYPFLPAFGPADTRERCIESSQAVYDRLLLRTPNLSTLPFETLALLAKDEKGGIDQDKAKELIRLFRPERDGALGKLEFVKSVDFIYKQLRLLSANISNSSQIDKAIESLVNIVFYIILGCFVLSSLGEDPRAIFFSFSSVILGFAFMFGASSSKYFEGVLFILVQRPYGVGDRIHLSNPQNETSPDGSSCWIVEKVTLNTTTVYWGTTNERATLSNGAVANLRVINAARSPNATIYVELKFGIDTPYEKIAIFKTAVEQFLKERPREWLTFIGFRPTEVAVDRGFIGYKIIAQHRNHWQAVGGILESKSHLTTYCLEVAKQLEMRYHAPPLPVDLHMVGNATRALQALGGNSALDKEKIAEALRAQSSRSLRTQHEAFGGGDE